jgi:hypothetical protein
MTTAEKYAKMSELMENAGDHLPEGLFIDMYNQLKRCKDDHYEREDELRKVNEIVKDKNESLVQIKEIFDRHYEFVIKAIEDRDKYITKLERCSRISDPSFDVIKAEVIEAGKNYKKPKKIGGFQTPKKISKELRVFLKLDEGTLICRTDVTRGITTFIRDHTLYGDTKREIDVWGDSDASRKLKALLVPEEGDVITWFNLQKYLAKHYPKPTPPAPQPCLNDIDSNDG